MGRLWVYTCCGLVVYSDSDPLPCVGIITVVYTRVLTRVQLTSGSELSSNPPMDMGRVSPGYNPGWGRSHWRQIRVRPWLEGTSVC